ncbi:hypothetical protein NDU88_003473 [Pleurodeles waltl]|uniref:Uncharacterized protein n=1 Tax=Pleurodeles waltl TaxID=8319 RepID=A0AAV7N086_PLEWA|nr:hypothetical protein NDU88_003473 [Pleurodeles waltl]
MCLPCLVLVIESTDISGQADERTHDDCETCLRKAAALLDSQFGQAEQEVRTFGHLKQVFYQYKLSASSLDHDGEVRIYSDGIMLILYRLTLPGESQNSVTIGVIEESAHNGPSHARRRLWAQLSVRSFSNED